MKFRYGTTKFLIARISLIIVYAIFLLITFDKLIMPFIQSWYNPIVGALIGCFIGLIAIVLGEETAIKIGGD